MLPHVDADDGGVSEERILVSRSDNFELFGGRVIALTTIPNQSTR